MGNLKENFTLIIFIVAIIFLALGYAWRMVQVSSNETQAFEVGFEAGEQSLYKVLTTHQYEKRIIYYYNFRITPLEDGKFVVELNQI